MTARAALPRLTPTAEEQVKGLLAANARQAEMIDRLEKALNQQRRTNERLRQQLEARDQPDRRNP